MFDVFWICGLLLAPFFIVIAIVLLVFFAIAGPKKFMNEMKLMWQFFVRDLKKQKTCYNRKR